jgi:hypothetical protein
VQTFDNPGAFAAHLERILAGLPEAEEAALRAAGGFLLDAARAAAEREGCGVLGQWLETAIEGRQVVIGLRDDAPADVIALAFSQEFGTVGQAPRAVLAGTAFRHGTEAASLMGRIVAEALAGLPRQEGNKS